MFKCFSHHYKDGTIETTKCKTKQKQNLRRILDAKDTPFFRLRREEKREDNIKDVRNLFRLKKDINNNAFKDI